MSQPSRTPLVLAARVVLHATALYFCVYAFNGLETISDLTEIQIESLYAGHYSYLTIIGLCFTTVTHALALVDDFVGSFLPPITFLKRVGSVIALPLESLISILYWSILAINRDLLIPPKSVADPLNPGQLIQESIVVPFPLDLSLHALPAIFLCLDFFLFSKQFPQSVKPGLVTVVFTLGYCIWLEHCASMNGFYAYPLLNELGPTLRPVLYFASSLTFLGINLAAQSIHDKIWGGSELKGKKRE